MSPEERQNVLCIWNAFVVAVALYYLDYGIVSSLTIGVAVLISSLIGYGQRHLVRAGFSLMVITIGVVIGILPPPKQWLALSNTALTTICRVR